MEQTIQPEHVTMPDPKLQQALNEPKGVIRKNLKVWIFLGACAVVVSAVSSATGRRRSLAMAPHRSMSFRSRPFRTTRITTSRISRISSRRSGSERRRQQLRKRPKRTSPRQ